MKFLQSLVSNAGRYATEATDLNTLARLAGDRGEYELEHRLQMEAAGMLRAARLLGTAALRVAQKLRATQDGVTTMSRKTDRTGAYESLGIAQSQPYLRALEDMDNAVYQAEREAAERIVEFYRALLAGHCMRHHKVAIWCTGSSCGISVNDRRFYELQADPRWFARHTPVLEVLRDIERTLDLKLAKYVRGQNLT